MLLSSKELTDRLIQKKPQLLRFCYNPDSDSVGVGQDLRFNISNAEAAHRLNMS